MKKLSPAEFADALQKGKGSAYLYVKNYGDEGIKQHLLNAVLNPIGYDTQIEGLKGEWVVDIFSMTADPTYYFKAALDTNLDNLDEWGIRHVSSIIATLAKRNYSGARKLLYKKLTEFKDNNQLLGIAGEIVGVEGVTGLINIFNILGTDNPEFCSDLIDSTEEKNAFLPILQTAAKTNTNIALPLKEYLAMTEYRAAYKRPESSLSSLQIFFDFIESPSKIIRQLGLFRKVAQNSTPEEIEFIFKKMLSESRKKQLHRYAHFFHRTKMPSLSEKLLKKVYYKDELFSHAFIGAFALLTSSKIRETGFDLLKQGKVRGIKLLVNNFHLEDWTHIKPYLIHIKDDYEARNCCGTLLEIVSKYNPKGTKDILLWVYENSPCSCYCCREVAVKALIDINKLPICLREEGKYDCNEEIRLLCSNLK